METKVSKIINSYQKGLRNSRLTYTQLFIRIVYIKYICIYKKIKNFSNKCLFSKVSHIYIKCTTLLPPFFPEIRGFIVKNWLYIYDSKYCPSLATTFSHLSGSVRILRRKNWSPFEAIHESIQFFTSS